MSHIQTVPDRLAHQGDIALHNGSFCRVERIYYNHKDGMIALLTQLMTTQGVRPRPHAETWHVLPQEQVAVVAEPELKRRDLR